jgi:hypothetical protein
LTQNQRVHNQAARLLESFLPRPRQDKEVTGSKNSDVGMFSADNHTTDAIHAHQHLRVAEPNNWKARLGIKTDKIQNLNFGHTMSIHRLAGNFHGQLKHAQNPTKRMGITIDELKHRLGFGVRLGGCTAPSTLFSSMPHTRETRPIVLHVKNGERVEKRYIISVVEGFGILVTCLPRLPALDALAWM